jgi:flagellar basal body-associated protein FliL
MNRLKKILIMLIAVTLLCGNGIMAFADDDDDSSSTSAYGSPGDQYASDEWKNQIRTELNRYYSDLKIVYNLTDEKIERMDKIYNGAMNYMQYASLTMTELTSYESQIENYLSELAKENTSGTEKFLMLSNEVPITSANYGEQTVIVLSLINLGKNDITDVVVTPTVSNDNTKWPFDIEQAYDAQCVDRIPASDTTEDAYNNRRDISWNFNVRSDVLTGCYPLTFHAIYYQSGSLVETDIVTYINIKGSNPNKTLIEDTDKQNSNPRIIVTGYKTEPEEVYAGTVFKLTVSVKNTSKETDVENVLFNMEATVEGKDSDATYAAFLPTSGSSSVYTEKIAAGQTYDMSIEMEAKSDLSQKPYVLTVNMKYDTDDQINISDTANVSIPIKQEAKIDTGSAEIMPESIAVGEQSNVMFSIFNTGKTTLYNVKVTYESETVDSGITYLGNVAPGATGNVDSMLTGIAPDEGDGIVKAVITYEDESGNESSFEKDINLYVYEMSYDDNFEDDYTMDIDEDTEKQGIPGVAIAGIIAAVVIVIIVVAVIVSKKKKAKKHKEDMDLLDEDDDL